MKIGYTAATGAGTNLKSSPPGGWVSGMKIDNKDHLSPADLAEELHTCTCANVQDLALCTLQVGGDVEIRS